MRIGFMTAAASTSCATNRQQKTARESRRRWLSAALLCVHPSHGTGATLLFPGTLGSRCPAQSNLQGPSRKRQFDPLPSFPISPVRASGRRRYGQGAPGPTVPRKWSD